MKIETGVVENNYTAKTDEEIKAIAMSLFKGEIFTDRHLHPGEKYMVQQIFMPLVFMDEVAIQQLVANEVDMIYEFMSEAMPMGVNGCPMFPSFRYLNTSDTAKVLERYRIIKETMDSL